MSLPDLSSLDAYYLRVDLIEATAEQIKKDFYLHDQKIVFSGNAEGAYQELFQQIQPIIDRLLNLDSSRFFSLLYAIDVNEEKVREVLFEDHDKNPSEEITRLIIQREMIKIILREYFKQLS